MREMFATIIGRLTNGLTYSTKVRHTQPSLFFKEALERLLQILKKTDKRSSLLDEGISY